MGDAAEICYIELVDFNEAMLATAGGAETKTGKRSRRGAKKKTEGEAPKKVKAEAKAKTPAKEKKAAAKPESAEPEADCTT